MSHKDQKYDVVMSVSVHNLSLILHFLFIIFLIIVLFEITCLWSCGCNLGFSKSFDSIIVLSYRPLKSHRRWESQTWTSRPEKSRRSTSAGRKSERRSTESAWPDTETLKASGGEPGTWRSPTWCKPHHSHVSQTLSWWNLNTFSLPVHLQNYMTIKLTIYFPNMLTDCFSLCTFTWINNVDISW